MKKNTFGFSVFTVFLIIIGILFSACSNNADPVDPNEGNDTSTPVISGNASASENDELYSYGRCFVAPSDNDETRDCTPGYLYMNYGIGNYKLLLAKKLKECPVAEFKNSLYAATEENEIIEVSKIDGSYKIVYTAKHGSIDYISSVVCVNRYVYFNDGNYIIELDPLTNKCEEKLESNKKICAIQAGGEAIKKYDHSFYCDICGNEGEYFIWTIGSEDDGYESYWHHPETGEDELIDINLVFTYGSDWQEEYNKLGWKVEK